MIIPVFKTGGRRFIPASVRSTRTRFRQLSFDCAGSSVNLTFTKTPSKTETSGTWSMRSSHRITMRRNCIRAVASASNGVAAGTNEFDQPQIPKYLELLAYFRANILVTWMESP